jgi:hypothetical protein
MSTLPTVPQPKKSKLPVQLPAVTNGQLPVVVKAITHPVRALKEFAGQAETLNRHHDRMQRAIENVTSVRRNPHLNLVGAQAWLDDARAELKGHETHYGQLAKDLQRDLDEKFNPDDAFDEDYRLTEESVRMHIAMLVGSFANANPGNPEAYIGMMVEEVMAESPSLVVLASACSRIRRTVKFPPTTAEVIEAIKEETELWDPRLSAIDDCDRTAAWLREELKEATEIVAAQKAEREEQRRLAEEKKRADDEMRAKPLEVGDRVRHSNLGNGTVTRKWLVDEGDGGLTVLFDSDDCCWILISDLKRLIPSDTGFEIPAARLRALEKNLAEERVRQERRLRPVVGDRVFDDPRFEGGHGAGTVTCAGDFELGGFDDGFTIQFDSGVTVENYIPVMYYFSRLLPGDPEFEIRKPPSPGFCPDYAVDTWDDDEPDQGLGIFSSRDKRVLVGDH